MDNSEELVQLLEDDIQANLEKPGGYRICNGCGKIKNLNSDDYPRDQKAKLGFSLRCKDCKVRPEKPEEIEEERPQRIFPKTDFDDLCFERKVRDTLQPKIYSTDTESSKLFKE